LRLVHFETFQPICPRCLIDSGLTSAIELAEVFTGDNESVDEGVLNCTESACQQQYPIIDGVPIIVPDVALTLSTQVQSVNARADLSDSLSGVLGDALGDACEFNTRRQHLSIYGWDGYAEFGAGQQHSDLPAGDPRAVPSQMGSPGAVSRCLAAGLPMLDSLEGPAVDLGCAVGRTTFELAKKTDEPVLGLDLSFAMLQLAQQVLKTGTAVFPLKELGVVYRNQRLSTPFQAMPNVDFWLCDAMVLPFRAGTFGTVNALNLLDCVPSPITLLQNIEKALMGAGEALIGCPYDWSTGASAINQWIGGHSQRTQFAGRSEALLEALLSEAGHPQSLAQLRLKDSLPRVAWQTRLNARSINHYQLHLVAAQKVPPE
jgi:SAM-dependent methyltransferase/uncharacterized protein YbaR (Trm112 family)